jgi:hypothetical protein
MCEKAKARMWVGEEYGDIGYAVGKTEPGVEGKPGCAGGVQLC